MGLERSELLAAPVPGAVEGVLGDVLHRAVREGPDDLLLCTPETGETWTATSCSPTPRAVASACSGPVGSRLEDRHVPG